MCAGHPLKTLGLWTLTGMLAAVLTAGCCNSGVQADADGKSGVEIGQAMPGFTMTDLKGVEHTLEQYKGKIVVLDFASQECPYSRATDPHLKKLHESYEEQGVVFLAIDSHATTTVEEIAAYAEEHELPFPILKDVDNAYADVTNAQRTPEIFIVDREGKLAYHGAFDDGRNPGEGDTPYVKNAIDALLAGNPVDPATSKAIGCTIKRK